MDNQLKTLVREIRIQISALEALNFDTLDDPEFYEAKGKIQVMYRQSKSLPKLYSFLPNLKKLKAKVES